jgi:peptide/nickel transport system substrate-binding protein
MSPRSTGITVATVVVALGVALAGVLASCAPRTRRTPDDTLVVLIESPMKTADPRYALSNYDLKLSKLVAPGLIAVDTADLAPRLELAERVDRIDDLTIDVTLRAGLRFSDGAPVTAADVAWTFDTVTAQGSDSFAHKQLSERFASVTPRGDLTVRFALRGKLATFLTDLDFGILARHAAGPDGRFPTAGLVGAGPYKLVSLESTRVVLAANPHYHGDKPRLPRVEIRTVRDASARILMLVGGSADLVQNAVRLDLVDDVIQRPRIQVEAAPSAILSYLLINNRHPVLKDVRVRRAIALAVDRPRIIAAKLGGRAVPATGLLPTSHWAYSGDVDRWDHDVAAARRLLDEAGLRDPDGAGPLPRLRLTYKTSTDLFRVSIARVLAAQLGEIGIEVDVRAFEFATFFADIKRGEYELATMQSTDLIEPDFYFTYFHSSRIPTPANPDAGNRWFYENARVDELTDLGRRELDPEARYGLYAEVQKIVASDVPIVPLWHEHVVVVANKDVAGYAISPNARLGGLASATK